MATGINTKQTRSVAATARTNFIPSALFQQFGTSAGKSYLDFLRAKYIDALKQVTEYNLYTIDESTAYRPEYISFKHYSTVDYWWIVCFYNGVIHPMRDLYPSRVIKIPSFTQITQMYQRMTLQDSNIGKIVTI
jgi:hypothetical protein